MWVQTVKHPDTYSINDLKNNEAWLIARALDFFLSKGVEENIQLEEAGFIANVIKQLREIDP